MPETQNKTRYLSISYPVSNQELIVLSEPIQKRESPHLAYDVGAGKPSRVSAVGR